MEDVQVPISRECKTGMINGTTLVTSAERKYDYSKAVADLINADVRVQAAAATGIHASLLAAAHPPIQSALDSGMVPRLVTLLKDPRVQSTTKQECTCIFMILATGTTAQSHALVLHGVIPALVRVATFSERMPWDVNVASRCILALGKLAGDSESTRDVVLKCGLVDSLIRLPQSILSSEASLMARIAYCMTSLCHWKTSCKEHARELISLLPTFVQLVNRPINDDDDDVLRSATLGIAYLADSRHGRSDAVLQSGVVDVRLVELLAHRNAHVIANALRAIGNTLVDSDVLPRCKGLIPALYALLSSEQHKSSWKEACWVVSNLTASAHHIQTVIDSKLIPLVLAMFQNGAGDDVKREAVWVICNGIREGTDAHRRYFLRQGSIPHLCNMLASPFPTVVSAALEALERMMQESKDDVCTSAGVIDDMGQNDPACLTS